MNVGYVCHGRDRASVLNSRGKQNPLVKFGKLVWVQVERTAHAFDPSIGTADGPHIGAP
jgi:hypothetical protein